MLKLLRRLRFLLLFIITICFCLLTALSAELHLTHYVDLFFSVVLIASILVIGHKENKFLTWIVFFGIIHLLQIVIGFWVTHRILNAFKSFEAMTFFLLLTFATLNLTLQDKTISVTTLFGSLSAYLFIGLTFAYLYLLIYALAPSSLTGLMPTPEVRAIYYSFITLTTVGFGDIIPKSPLVQTLSWMEAFSGQAYMAIFISQLVGRYVALDIKDS